MVDASGFGHERTAMVLCVTFPLETLLMNNVNDIVINDGQATPVAHTFTPKNVSANLVEYRDASYNLYGAAGPRVLEGETYISIGNRPLVKSGDNYKATLRIRIPVMEDSSIVSSDSKLAYTLSANVDLIIPGRATAAQIDDLFAFLANINANSQWALTVTDQQMPT